MSILHTQHEFLHVGGCGLRCTLRVPVLATNTVEVAQRQQLQQDDNAILFTTRNNPYSHPTEANNLLDEEKGRQSCPMEQMRLTQVQQLACIRKREK